MRIAALDDEPRKLELVRHAMTYPMADASE